MHSTLRERPRRFVRPTIEPRAALLLLAVFVGVAVTQALAMYSVLRAQGLSARLPIEIAGYLAGALGAWLALPAVQLAVGHARLGRAGIRRLVSTHLAGYVAFTLVHTTTMVLLRGLARWVLPGMLARFGGAVPQALYELQADLILYPAIVCLWYALDAWDERRVAQVRAASLERDLAQVRLEALSARLDPHFLFNALHTIGSVAHHDLDKTDRLIAGLGDLLRAALREDGGLSTVGEERRCTEAYLEIQGARFGDRLEVIWSPERWDAALLEVRVPRFSLQSLVENAIKHNADRDARLCIEISLALEGSTLVLRVADDGRGFVEERIAEGHGLRRLQDMVGLAFGEEASVVWRNRASGGAEVALRLPCDRETP